MAITTHDIVPDSPTNNFATLNPVKQQWNATRVLKEGNLLNYRVTHSSSTATLILTGKQYWEVYSTYGNQNLGVIDDNASQSGVTNSYDASSARGIYNLNVAGYVNGSGVVTTGGPIAGYTTPSVIMFAVDIDAGKMWVGKDGVWNGDPDAGTNPFWTNLTSGLAWTPWVHAAATTQANDAYFNFGQDPTFGGNKNTPATVNGVTGPFAPSGDAEGTAGLFHYPPPAGFKSLCTANLPEMTPDVTGDVPQDYFRAVTYTGSYPTANSVNVGFNPDLIWLKSRTQGYWHGVWDSIRTVNGYEYISTNSTNGEATSGDEISFITNGFRVDTGQAFNEAGQGDNNMIAWCWKAGGAPTADNSNTSGAMTANSVSLNGTLQSNYTPAGSPTIYPKRMSINTAAGFSIVKYVGDQGTGSTVPHGLLQVPQIVLVKPLNGTTTYGWRMYTEMTGNTKYLQLDATAQAATYTDWNSTSPTTNVFTVNSSSAQTNNENGTNYIAYCWHSVEGYSKFGSYTGNGSADGTFVYCGFRPAFVMCKCTSDTTTTHTSWAMFDNARDSSNVMNKVLYANKGINEGYRGDGSTAATDIYIDFLSNGFKVRSTKEEVNDTGETYIFMAFAEQPFKYANAR